MAPGYEQACREEGTEHERGADADHARSPAEAIEDLAQQSAAREAAQEIAGEIEAACRTPVGRGGAADEAGRRRLGEEGAHADHRQTEQQCGKARAQQQRQPPDRHREGGPQRRTRAEAGDDLAGERRGDHRRQENEIDHAQHHHADAEARAHQHEIHVGERADEGEQDKEADGEGRAQRGIGEVEQEAREGRSPSCMRAHVGLPHGLDARDREPHQHGTREIERREDVEIRGESQVIDDAGGQQAAEQVGGDVAGDIGGECAGGVGGRRVLAKVGERERKGRRHAKPLDDAQGGEDRQRRHAGQQQGRQGEDRQAEEDAAAAIERAAEQADRKPADRHADRAGVDGKAHGSGRAAIGSSERRQDGLRREQIDDGQKGGQADRERAQGTRHVTDLSGYMLWSLGSCRMSNDSSTTGVLPALFHQCDVACVSRATSPALCRIGTAQLLAFS